MNFINAADLTFKTNAELIAMIRKATESLYCMNVADPEYAATIGSIQIMKRTLAARQQMNGPKF